MSNKKTLLNEGTIRRFMKLANMDNLAESYLDRYDVEEGMRPAKDDDEEVEEGMRPAKHDDDKEVEEGMRAAKEDDEVEEGMRGLGKHDDDDEPAMRDLDEEEEMELDMDAEADAPAEDGGADEAMVKKLVDAIAGAIEGATGVEVAVEGGDEEPDMDMGGEDAPDMDMGMDDEAAMRDEPAKHDLEEDEDFDAYIAEVTRRVAKRIIKSKISK